MKVKFVLAFLLMFGLSASVCAQTESEGANNKAVRNLVEQESIVVYDIPDDIMNNLGTNPSNLKRPNSTSASGNNATTASGGETPSAGNSSAGSSSTASTGNESNNAAKDNNKKKPAGNTSTASNGPQKKGVHKMDGYRIQVFSDGRDPKTLQARARARGNAIVAKFPKYRGQVYSFSSSPNWYTRVGNFRTSQEASAALAELKRAFPSFAGEMRVVKSPITIIK